MSDESDIDTEDLEVCTLVEASVLPAMRLVKLGGEPLPEEDRLRVLELLKACESDPTAWVVFNYQIEFAAVPPGSGGAPTSLTIDLGTPVDEEAA